MKTFLFIGVSFADPNVLYLLSRVKQLLDKNGRKHFCILKRPTPDDYEGAEYDCKRFPHWLSDLRRYNIQPVLVESYDEVTNVLEELGRRSHLHDVFISGSAADFNPYGEARFQELCRLLGSELIRKNFNIISGFGRGVADAVIVGAMQALARNDDQRLQLRPFPQAVPEGIDRAEFWKDYRDKMIADAGVCVVLAGNKQDESGAIVLASGVSQETELTRQHGKLVVPVGATGHVARELWDAAVADQQAWFGDHDVCAPLQVLGDESAEPARLVQAVLDILAIISK